MSQTPTDGDHEGPQDGGYRAGDRLAAEGRLEEAQKAYARAAQAGDGVAAGKLGVLREHGGDHGGALEAYRRGDDAGDGFSALRLGLLLAGTGQWEEAEGAYARANERGQRPPGFDLVRAVGIADRPARTAQPGTAPNPALANPVLVGAAAVLLVIIAVFLAYNANNGLPFVPTKELKVDIASGADLVAGNEVREGGFRIGLISEMKPIALKSGQIGAQLTLKLDQSHGSVPVDSTASIRPRSVLGLKYVDLHVGSAHRCSATVPRCRSRRRASRSSSRMSFRRLMRRRGRRSIRIWWVLGIRSRGAVRR